MKDIMDKVQNLYSLLEERLATIQAREVALAELMDATKAERADLDVRAKRIKAKEKEHRGLDIAEAEMAKAKEALADVRAKYDALEDAELVVQSAKEEAAAILGNAQDVQNDVNATRERLVIEVKKFEERKKKVREEVLAELSKGR